MGLACPRTIRADGDRREAFRSTVHDTVRRMTRATQWAVALVALTLAMAAGTGEASAHRDGCHAQHSCPSDTGSYVCGDTGNYSECPGMAGSASVVASGSGFGSTLTGASSWSAAPTSTTYQWTRSGQPIAGATTTSYVIGADDLGQALVLTATGTDGRGQTALASSSPVNVPPLAGQASILQTGATVGTPLSAKIVWNAPVTESYQWQRAGIAILGATAATYLVTKDDVGQPISLSVAGTAGSSRAAAQTPPITPTVAIALKLSGPKLTVPAGRTAVIRGVATSTAPVAGLSIKVKITRLVHGTWKTVITRTLRVSSAGTFTMNQRIAHSQVGKWKARATFAGDRSYLAAVATRSFKVR